MNNTQRIQRDDNSDVLRRLHEVLASTPLHSHVTRPLSRTLLQRAVAEIERLRAELARIEAER